MSDLSRRQMCLRISMLFNGLVGAILGIPVVRYLLYPVTRGQSAADNRWTSLGAVDRFPSGQTRLATYRSPVANLSDGETAEIPCWVRNIDGNNFQVFAINCAHLGCPVRWFPQSRLFMCPCHGGAYYEDGSRASGPPERGLFQYPFKILDGQLQIQAGELPTPGPSAANRDLINIRRQSPCA
ncbi:MAG: Rieske 2Fe-2S domain-containing protein [Bryobacteraceae bacterium]|jgi:menaquinol-cytochrome c reductase iron-sulfur subunit